MSTAIRALEAKRAAAFKAARTVNDAAVDGVLSDAQSAEFDKHMAEANAINAQIERVRTLELAEAGIRGDGSVDVAAHAVVKVEENRDKDTRRGFRSFGEFAQAVRIGSMPGARRDERLNFEAAAPSTFGNEGSGVDGGFTIPPAFSDQIFNLSLEDGAILPMTDQIPVTGNSMAFPKDETTPWGTDGVRAYWQNEGSLGTPTKPKFGESILRLRKLMALVPISDEMLADSGAMAAYLPNLMGRSIRFKTDEALLFGLGDGQPLGAFTNAGTTNFPGVVQNKESGQAASTIVANNIFKMIARLMPGSFPRATWLITPDALPQIFGLTLGNYPIFLPMNSGAADSPFLGTLMGRPLQTSQHAAALSSQGDIMLGDFSYYRTLKKGQGIDMASSMHLYFDADATAFRALFRVDGAPKLANPVTQNKGANTLSPFVTLQNR